MSIERTRVDTQTGPQERLPTEAADVSARTGVHGSEVITAFAVVVPVHDEEGLLPRCVDALRVAVRHAQAMSGAPQIDVVLVLDSCTDASRVVARETDFRVVEISARNVGVARTAGTDSALRRLTIDSSHSLASTWLAHTDADSAVPRNWISHHIALARGGADIVIGTVRPDHADLSQAQRTAWAATHVPGRPNGHVHGANLGIRADVYCAVGGYLPMREHEDVDLVARARRSGARVAATDDNWVLTSGRATGRTTGGYARYLREDLLARSASAS